VNLALFALVLSLSAAEKAKSKGETAQQLLGRAKQLQLKGDPQGAKKLYQQVMGKFGDDPLDPAMAGDVDLGGAAAVNSIGDLARVEIKFLDLEISSGKSRIFNDPKQALEDILTDIDLNDVAGLRDKMWVRMNQGQCGAELDEMTPDEAMEELRTELAPKNVKVKNYESGTGSAPTLKVALKTDHYLELKMSKYGKGWIWNHTVICSRAL